MNVRRQGAERRVRLNEKYAELQHGSWATYSNWSCRCEPCKQAASEHNAQGAARRKAFGAQHPELLDHGRLTTYMAYGCRCDECRRASTEYTRTRRTKTFEGANQG